MKEIAPGVAWLPTSFVNAYFVGDPGGAWTLVDTGLPGFGNKVRAEAWRRFNRKPNAIILTHGHFDHAGNALMLANEWQVPIYCHRLELPYLTGRSPYPPPDPTVGGFLAQASRMMPSRGCDLTPWIRELPANGAINELPDWRWVPTPGHSPGHISLFRENDHVLLAGDALATVDMDSYAGALTNQQKLWRAGTPFICDWAAAEESVLKLAELKPKIIACGHGTPMDVLYLPQRLHYFASEFPIPAHGRYVGEAAKTNERGVVRLPARPFDLMPWIAAISAIAAAIGYRAIRPRKTRLQMTLEKFERPLRGVRRSWTW